MNARERELRVRELRAQGLSQNAIARRLGISRRTVQRIYHRLGQGSPWPSSEPSYESGRPTMEERRPENVVQVGGEATAPPPGVNALPHIARQLHDAALRINQVEPQQLHDAEIQARQAEEALQAVQAFRAEQWKMMRDVTQSVSEVLQATAQLLQRVPEARR
jgi:AraC-like DNA-binding protein